MVSQGTSEELRRYRSFRHIVRHAYEREFLWKGMKDLVVDYPTVSTRFKNDIETFLKVLDEMIGDLETAPGE